MLLMRAGPAAGCARRSAASRRVSERRCCGGVACVRDECCSAERVYRSSSITKTDSEEEAAAALSLRWRIARDDALDAANEGADLVGFLVVEDMRRRPTGRARDTKRSAEAVIAEREAELEARAAVWSSRHVDLAILVST